MPCSCERGREITNRQEYAKIEERTENRGRWRKQKKILVSLFGVDIDLLTLQIQRRGDVSTTGMAPGETDLSGKIPRLTTHKGK